MMELLRNRALQGQSQGMPPQQQQQRQLPFSGMPQLGANGLPSFPHDPSQGLSNAPSQFGNAPGGQTFSNPMQLQQTLARNQNPMFSNQGNDPMRQLNLMLQQESQSGMPSNNTMAAFQQRLQQTQQQQQQHPQQQHASHPQHPQGMGGAQLPPGMFVGAMNPSMSGNIPANLQNNQLAARQAGMMPQQGMGDGQMQMQGRTIYPRSPIDIQGTYDKMQRFLQSIRDTEMRIKQYQLQQQVSGGSDHLAAEIDKLQKDLQRRREVLRRVKAYFRDVVQLFASCTPGGVAPPVCVLSLLAFLPLTARWY